MALPTFRNAKSVYPPFCQPSYISHRSVANISCSRTRIVEIYPRMRKLREGSTVYDGVVTTASLRPFHSLPYSRRFEEINSRYSREIKIDFVRSELVTIDRRPRIGIASFETWILSRPSSRRSRPTLTSGNLTSKSKKIDGEVN